MDISGMDISKHRPKKGQLRDLPLGRERWEGCAVNFVASDRGYNVVEVGVCIR
jgi:hypothetical protein